MALSKVAAVIYIRELIHDKGREAEIRYLNSLSPEDGQCFQKLLPSNKLPIEQLSKYCELAVPVLFPDKSLDQGLRQLGYQNAKNDMKGIYRVLLKIASVETVIKNAAVIWKTYHDEGQAFVRRLKANQYDFIVEKYPEITKCFRNITDGYITGLLELTGAKNIKVIRDDADPNAWKWLITMD